jgi:2-phospho-L-lactate/phosphoenolpyruvate guanylyltransferase
MSLCIIIPVRGLADGKSRLATALSSEMRALLVENMLRHVQSVARQVAPTYLVSRDERLLSLADNPIVETGHEINSSLENAVHAIAGCSAVLALSADLPLLEIDDLLAMINLLDSADVVAASDRSLSGTNALLMSAPRLIPYCFGEGSFEAHRAAAAAAEVRFASCNRTGVATDIDVPSDLMLASAAIAKTFAETRVQSAAQLLPSLRGTCP